MLEPFRRNSGVNKVPGHVTKYWLVLIFAAILTLPATVGTASEFFTLKGHGGPVMGITVSPTHGKIATASFDNSVGLWTGRTPQWLEEHTAAVNAIAFIDEHRMVSAGDDFSVILWNLQSGRHKRIARHRGKVVSLAVSPDRAFVASASWDGSVGLAPLAGGEPVFLEGHGAGVNDVSFSRDGALLYSASTDGTIRSWDLRTNTNKRVLLRHGFGINVLALDTSKNWLAYGAVDGVTRVVDLATDRQIADFSLDRRPILSMAASPDGNKLAVGDGHGFIMIIDTGKWEIERDFRAALRGPIWALAFSNDGENIHAGGIEDIVYSWPLDQIAEFGPMTDSKPEFLRDPDEMENGERQFARKCSICHSLSPDGQRKAGPTLHGLFGRQAGSIEDYRYSDTLDGSNIVWNENTVDRLFDLGPDNYIPGSKMPMQRITIRRDRDDLIAYLRHATTAEGQSKGK